MADPVLRWNHYDPSDTRRAKNVGLDLWSRFQDAIIQLHNDGCTKQDILDAIENDSVAGDAGFTPTMNQLVRQMRVWKLRADQREPHSQTDPEIHHSNASIISQPPGEGTNLPLGPANTQVIDTCEGFAPTDASTLSDISSASSSSANEPILVPVATQNSHASIHYEDPFLAQIDLDNLSLLDYDECGRPDDVLDDVHSSLNSLSIDSWSSWSFGRITGMPSVRSLSDECAAFASPNPATKPRISSLDTMMMAISKSARAARLEAEFQQRTPDFFHFGRVFVVFTNIAEVLTLNLNRCFVVASPVHESDNAVCAVPLTTARLKVSRKSWAAVNVVSIQPPRSEDSAAALLNKRLASNPILLISSMGLSELGLSFLLGETSVLDFPRTEQVNIAERCADLGSVSSNSMPRFRECAWRFL